jgi:hypothetical protein
MPFGSGSVPRERISTSRFGLRAFSWSNLCRRLSRDGQTFSEFRPGPRRMRPVRSTGMPEVNILGILELTNKVSRTTASGAG